jgi:hypothetical protein
MGVTDKMISKEVVESENEKKCLLIIKKENNN